MSAVRMSGPRAMVKRVPRPSGSASGQTWSVSPASAAWAFLAYLALNQLVGVFVTPRVMGRHMRMHPFVVTVSILSGGILLGAAGAILALPLAAALQSVISEFARPGRK